MKRVLLAAVLVSAAHPAGALQTSTGTVSNPRLAHIDRLLNVAESLLEDHEGAWGCRGEFSLPDLIEKFARQRIHATFAKNLTAAMDPDLRHHYACRAVAAKNTTPCAEMADFPLKLRADANGLNLRQRCQADYYELMLGAALIDHRSGAADLCLKRNELGDRELKPQTAAAACGLIAKASDLDATCRKLSPHFESPDSAKNCQLQLRFLMGDASACPGQTDPGMKERCLGFAAFKKAAAAGTPRLRRPGVCGYGGAAARDGHLKARWSGGATAGVHDRHERLLGEGRRLGGRGVRRGRSGARRRGPGPGGGARRAHREDGPHQAADRPLR